VVQTDDFFAGRPEARAVFDKVHHLEVALPHEIDEEARDWLREAADAAGGHRTERSGRS
jgi:hypothetical protein